MRPVAKTISQRELRNESAAVMDAVEAGETVVVTRNGHPVAELRRARGRQFATTAEVARALQGLPRVDLEAMRAEADQLLGPDRIDE
jgi:antitoxin (DNA-binding transcriptional repressor) of toxin-antitoxin stability system